MTPDQNILTVLEPGTLQIEKRGYLVKESCGDAEVSVVRQNGADGNISVKWRTIDRTAINGKDYNGGEGEINFRHGETQVCTSYILMYYLCMPKGPKH